MVIGPGNVQQSYDLQMLIFGMHLLFLTAWTPQLR